MVEEVHRCPARRPAPGRGARACGEAKHGGRIRNASLDQAATVVVDDVRLDVVALDEALLKLATLHPRKVEVVELRYFGGLGAATVFV